MKKPNVEELFSAFPGDLYEIVFFDHSKEMETALLSSCVGYITKSDKQPEHPKGRFVSVTCWRTYDTDPETNEANEERFNILLDNVVDFKKLDQISL